MSEAKHIIEAATLFGELMRLGKQARDLSPKEMSARCIDLLQQMRQAGMSSQEAGYIGNAGIMMHQCLYYLRHDGTTPADWAAHVTAAAASKEAKQ